MAAPESLNLGLVALMLPVPLFATIISPLARRTGPPAPGTSHFLAKLSSGKGTKKKKNYPL